jgi:competence protein ComEA
MGGNNKFLENLVSEPARLKKYLVIVAVVIFVIACIFVYFSGGSGDSSLPEVSKVGSEDSLPDDGDVGGGDDAADAADADIVPADIIVDVGGAVVTPGVYTLAFGSRVFEALDAAGGLCKDADVKDINQAAEMADGDKIYIPSEKEVKDGYVSSNPASNGGIGEKSENIPGGDSKVNINTADSTGLQALNGVGPATAEKIIDYRNSNGKFTSIEKLKNVSGIGDKTYLKLKDHICI